MFENVESVQKGFRLLIKPFSEYVGDVAYQYYGDEWWYRITCALDDQYDLPSSGTFTSLIGSLDIANCIRVLDRLWNPVFRDYLPLNCRIWAKELMGVRNIVAHHGQQDIEQPVAERALNTMFLLCENFDAEVTEQLKEIYREVRSRADDTRPTVYEGLMQPESVSTRGALTEGSLLQFVGTDLVKKTQLTRKITYGGRTVVYPVYQVRLDLLYYNDQNDRIATWISRYESENGADSLKDLNQDIFNRIIENFIVESNPESINTTQKNIDLIGQQLPGVTLADGRVVDGNRRFTCLRRIQRSRKEPVYFETVLMDVDIQEDKKQIKMLELAIQHGEEARVNYDLIDFAVGTYRDVVQTNLLTAEEYAQSTGEKLAEVKARIEIASTINEFLNHIHLPGQYHAARDYQVYSLFQEMMAPLKKLKNDEEKTQLKQIVFTNALLKALPDQRKFIRDIKSLVTNDSYNVYFERQMDLVQQINEKLSTANFRNKEDADAFASENDALVEESRRCMESALQSLRSQRLRSTPNENAQKCIDLLMEIDPRLFGKMDENEREAFEKSLDDIAKIVQSHKRMLNK